MNREIKDLGIHISDGNYSSKYPRSEEFVKEGVPFIRANNLVNGEVTDEDMYFITPEKHAILLKGHLQEGDVLITTRGNIGQVGIVPKRHIDSNINAQLVLLRTNPKELYNRYLLWALQSQSVKKQYQTLQTGTALKQLPVGKLEQVSIKVTDIISQHNIADNLDKIYKIINDRKKELNLLDDLIKARFVEMFGTPLLNENCWNVINAGQCCSVITDGSHFSPQGQNKGYPMLSVKDMRNDGFHYETCKLVSEESFQTLKKQGCIPQEKDVLISKDGSYFCYGFVLSEYKEQAILSSIAMLRPIQNIVNPYYLCNYMLSERIVKLVSDNYVTGAALKRVILKGIKQIPVMVPPINLQNEFELFVKQVDKSKFMYI